VISTYATIAMAEGGTSMLMPDGSLLVTLILFLALVPILNRILFKPITHVLEERDRLTTGSDTETHAIMNTIDARLSAYEEGIRDARSEGYRVVEQRRSAAVAARQEKITAAREAAERQIAGARSEIGAEADAARARLEADAREIAAEISSTLLGRAVGGAR
jgi:F-type H+-transporting ATPase subunit b